MDETLQLDEIKSVLSLFAQDIGHELANWLNAQKSLGLTELPVDDAQWGLMSQPVLVSAPAARSDVQTAVPAFEPKKMPAVQRQAREVPPLSAASGSCFAAFREMQSKQAAVLPQTPQERESALAILRARESSCRECCLGARRRDVLSGYGPSDASIMFVAAGGNPAELDAGRIMPGDVADLFDKIILAMAGLDSEARPERIYMTNVMKCACIPPREQVRAVARQCLGFLREEVRIISPRVIVIWGQLAYRTMSGSDALISQVRGNIEHFEGIPAIATHHPMEMIKNPKLKRLVWADLQLAIEVMRGRTGAGVS